MALNPVLILYVVSGSTLFDMGNAAQSRDKGFVCPVRGCDKKHNRRFSAMGLTQHLISKHKGEFEKRLKLKTEFRK